VSAGGAPDVGLGTAAEVSLGTAAEVSLGTAAEVSLGTAAVRPSSTSTATATARATGFLRDLADQLRAGDTYGRFDRFGDEHLLRPLIVTASQRAEISVSCEIDPATEGRLRAFYQAVAVGVEKATGVMTGAVIDLSHEGFGRALVLAGQLVAVADVLRDAQRFGFPDTESLAARGDHLVAAGVAMIEKYPEVARADD
jgi:probable nitrogen fixation protein